MFADSRDRALLGDLFTALLEIKRQGTEAQRTLGFNSVAVLTPLRSQLCGYNLLFSDGRTRSSQRPLVFLEETAPLLREEAEPAETQGNTVETVRPHGCPHPLCSRPLLGVLLLPASLLAGLLRSARTRHRGHAPSAPPGKAHQKSLLHKFLPERGSRTRREEAAREPNPLPLPTPPFSAGILSASASVSALCWDRGGAQ